MTDISTACRSFQSRKVLRMTKLPKPAPLKQQSVSLIESNYSTWTNAENQPKARFLGKRACRTLKLAKPFRKSAKLLNKIDSTERESYEFEIRKRSLSPLDWDESPNALSHDQERMRRACEYSEQSNNNNVTGLQIQKSNFWSSLNHSQQTACKTLELGIKFGYDDRLSVTTNLIAEKCRTIRSLGSGLGLRKQRDNKHLIQTVQDAQVHSNGITNGWTSDNGGDVFLAGYSQVCDFNKCLKVIDKPDSNNNLPVSSLAGCGNVFQDNNRFKVDGSVCHPISDNSLSSRCKSAADSSALHSLVNMKIDPRSETDCLQVQTYVNWTSENNENCYERCTLDEDQILNRDRAEKDNDGTYTYSSDEGFNEQECVLKLVDEMTDHMGKVSIHHKAKCLLHSSAEMSGPVSRSKTSDPDSMNVDETAGDSIGKDWGMFIKDSDVGNMYLMEGKAISRPMKYTDTCTKFTEQLRDANMTNCVIRLPLAQTSTLKQIQKVEEGWPSDMNTSRGRRRLFRKYSKTRTNEEIDDLFSNTGPEERLIYTTEELLKLGALPQSKLRPNSWLYLTKIYPQVCFWEVQDYLDTLQYIEDRSHVVAAHNVWTSFRMNFVQSKSEMPPLKPLIRGIGFGVPKAVTSSNQ